MKILTSLIISLMMISGALYAEEIELKGEVIKIEEIAEPSNDVQILQVQLRTQNREMVMARLGPAWYMDTELKPGDEITVKGDFTDDNKFRVREMVCNTVRYQIRGEDHEPLWLRTKLREKSHFYNPQNEKAIKGKIEDIYVNEKTSMMEAQVKSENGETVRVRFAPEWYLQNRLRLGDELELRGSEIKFDGKPMILTREIRNLRTNQEITLRNEQGFPDWCKGPCHNKEQGKPCCKDEKEGRGKK